MKENCGQLHMTKEQHGVASGSIIQYVSHRQFWSPVVIHHVEQWEEFPQHINTDSVLEAQTENKQLRATILTQFKQVRNISESERFKDTFLQFPARVPVRTPAHTSHGTF